MKDVVSVLQRPGAVAVIPTDTVYGVVARAVDEVAVERIFTQVKPRDHKPGTIVAASIDQLVELGIKRRYLKAVEQFWPGAVSVEIPHDITYLNRGTGRQAFRIPDDSQLLALLQETGPLQTTSANLPDQPTAETIDQAKAYFGNLVDYYQDGGNLAGHLPSTLIRIVDDAIEVIREGAVKIDPDTGAIVT